MTFLIFHVTSQLKCHVTFWVEHPHPDSAPYQVLGFMNLVNVDIKRFWFVTWPHDWYVTWPWAWGPLILSPQPAKFGTHRPCESGDITFFICHVATWSMCHVTLYVRCSHLNHHLAKFGVHMPCGSGDITFFICHVTTISKCHVTLWVGSPHPLMLNLVSIGLMELEIMAFIVSDPIPIPFPMPRFTNGHELINSDWIVNNLIVHNLLINYLKLIKEPIQKQLLTAVL